MPTSEILPQDVKAEVKQVMGPKTEILTAERRESSRLRV